MSSKNPPTSKISFPTIWLKILIVWFTYTALFKGTKKFLRLLVIGITWSYEQDLNVLGIQKCIKISHFDNLNQNAAF